MRGPGRACRLRSVGVDTGSCGSRATPSPRRIPSGFSRMGFRPSTLIWPARPSSLPARRFGMAEAASTFWLTRARRASPPAVKAFLTTNADIGRRPVGRSPRTRGREGSRHSLAQAAQAAPRARARRGPKACSRASLICTTRFRPLAYRSSRRPGRSHGA